MANADFEKWKTEAQALGEPKDVTIPLDVLIGEAADLAEFFKIYWRPGDGHAGLVSAGARLHEGLGDELLSLRLALQEAQTRYLLSLDPQKSHAAMIERGEFAYSEISAALEWLLDDGVEEPADKNLETLQKEHKADPHNADSLAQALHDFASLAKTLQDRLAGLGGFDVALIDEGLKLSKDLGEVGAASQNPEALAAKKLRDQMASLLQDKMRLIRAAARFVFRAQPKIARQAGSAYSRRRRNIQRLREKAANKAADGQ